MVYWVLPFYHRTFCVSLMVCVCMPNLEPFENGEDFGGIPFLDKPNWNPSTFNWLRRVIHIWYARWHAKMSGSMLYSHCWSSVDHGHHFVSFIPLFYGAQFSVVNIIWLVVWNIFFHILEIITPTDELNSIIFQRGRLKPPTSHGNPSKMLDFIGFDWIWLWKISSSDGSNRLPEVGRPRTAHGRPSRWWRNVRQMSLSDSSGWWFGRKMLLYDGYITIVIYFVRWVF